jgi:hypothetical protein
VIPFLRVSGTESVNILDDSWIEYMSGGECHTKRALTDVTHGDQVDKNISGIDVFLDVNL